MGCVNHAECTHSPGDGAQFTFRHCRSQDFVHTPATVMTPVDYTTLSDLEKALAVDIKGVYPVVSVGRASDTGQLIMTCRVLALKRDVCRVPCHDGQPLASMFRWVPMFFDLLPPTSLATWRCAAPWRGFWAPLGHLWP